MKLIKTMLVGVLGTATLLPALPAWADTDTAPVAGVASKPAPGAPTVGTTPTKPPVAAPTATATPGEVRGSAKHEVAGDVRMTSDADGRADARNRNRKAFLDARLAALRAGLELTPTQDALWPPVEQAVRALSTTHDAIRSDRRRSRMMAGDAAGSADGTARLKERAAQLIAMGQAMSKLADATGPLLRTLAPDQKQRLPILLHGFKPHRAMALAFDTDPGFGRHWRHRFGGDEMGGRFEFFADRFGGPHHGDGDGWRKDGWRGGDARFGSPDGAFGGEPGWHHHHHDAEGAMGD